jgi:hypothetical protein
MNAVKLQRGLEFHSSLPEVWGSACDGSGVLCEGGSVSGDDGDCGDGSDDVIDNLLC